ncbi:MAG TPA: class I adenylate-forming enzyme family protein [Methanocorpusculum sp.]|nr:class I adenylate-forming enzyme family protein [Methanocorpusculum sp.]HJJ51354.1 class I adenylate-forming enzyme family protein [Methanocorpusculum sp.]
MPRPVYRNDAKTELEYSDETKQSLYSMFNYGVEHAGREAIAIQYFGNRISYGELYDLVNKCAAGFLEHGVKKGDLVTVFLPNIPQCVIAVYALNRIGAVCNMIHPLSTLSELEHAVKLTDSKLILTFELNEGLAADMDVHIIRCRTPGYFPKNPKGFVMKTVYSFSVRKSAKARARVTEWSDLLAEGEKYLQTKPLPPSDVKADDTAVIMYTGGTTGPAKGVMISNWSVNYVTTRLLLENVTNTAHIGDGFLAILPLFHAFGLAVCIQAPLSSGMRVMLVPRFNDKECSNLLLKEKVAYVIGVPAMYERMYPYLKGHDLSFMKHVVCGGDWVSHDLAYRYNDILGKDKGGAEFRPGYGLTEACGTCSLTRNNYRAFPEGCVGLPVEGTDICLVKPGTCDLVPKGEEGELCILSPSLMKGYYKNPEATKDVLRIHPDGKLWLHTGDIFVIGEEDNLCFKSRIKRLVKVNGYNVYPPLIEAAMEGCPIISKACAVGFKWRDDRRIKLFVTLKQKMDQIEAEKQILIYANEHLNHWSVPKMVVILDEMPMTKMNKLDYMALQDRV